MKRSAFAFAAALVLAASCIRADVIRVGSFNIRQSSPGTDAKDGVNRWDERKEALVAELGKLDLDVFGLQEVMPAQMRYLRERMSDHVFSGEHRGADRRSDEASPIAFRQDRFGMEKCGTFWLSETPDTPGVKGWGAGYPRVCSWAVLRDRRTGARFVFANTHADNVSEAARKNGLLLAVNRMKEIAGGAPIVFTGDHNCTRDEAPAAAVREFLDDARDKSESGTRGPAATYHGFGRCEGPENAIDHVYVSRGTRVLDFTVHDDRRGEGLYLSDHRPITARIELK